MKKLVSCLLASMVAVSLAGCSSSGTASAAATSAPSESAAASAASYKAGTYTGSAEGHNGTVSVDVTFTDDAISSIEIKENSETPTLSDKALKDLPDEIVAQQTLNVDNVSGATFTSMAVKNAVADAVTQAGGDADALRKAPYEKAAEATDDISTDVLVIGGGTAGLMAAYEAGKAGVSTTLIEKLDVLGGTLIVTVATLKATVKKAEAELLIKKSDEDLHARYKQVTGTYRGDRHNRHLLIDSSLLGIDRTAKLIEEVAAERFGISGAADIEKTPAPKTAAPTSPDTSGERAERAAVSAEAPKKPPVLSAEMGA